jgi:hypothetical protein
VAGPADRCRGRPVRVRRYRGAVAHPRGAARLRPRPPPGHQAQGIAAPLDAYWDIRGLYEEARAWVDRARLALETPAGEPPPPDTPDGALWLFLTGTQAGRDIGAHRLDSAEHTYREIHQALLRHPESPQQRRRLAGVYHLLGMIAEGRGRLDQAEDWYRRSLT